MKQYVGLRWVITPFDANEELMNWLLNVPKKTSEYPENLHMIENN